MIRLVVFGSISVLGAIIDFFLTVLFVGWFDIPGWVALAMSMVVSGTIVYALHQTITFSDLSGRKLKATRLRDYLVVTMMIYLLRAVTLEALLWLGVETRLALALALIASFLVNFGISRFLIFRSTS